MATSSYRDEVEKHRLEGYIERRVVAIVYPGVAFEDILLTHYMCKSDPFFMILTLFKRHHSAR